MLVRFANKLFHHENIKPIYRVSVFHGGFFYVKKGEENREK